MAGSTCARCAARPITKLSSARSWPGSATVARARAAARAARASKRAGGPAPEPGAVDPGASAPKS
eukprot:14692890-Alexandrium_andersonii.AAC.1